MRKPRVTRGRTYARLKTSRTFEGKTVTRIYAEPDPGREPAVIMETAGGGAFLFMDWDRDMLVALEWRARRQGITFDAAVEATLREAIGLPAPEVLPH